MPPGAMWASPPTPIFMRPSVGADAHIGPSAGLAPHTAPLALCHCEPVRTLVWQSVSPCAVLPVPADADRGSLSFCGERKGGKNAVKTKVLQSFRG